MSVCLHKKDIEKEIVSEAVEPQKKQDLESKRKKERKRTKRKAKKCKREQEKPLSKPPTPQVQLPTVEGIRFLLIGISRQENLIQEPIR